MKKVILFLCGIIFSSHMAFASQCFIAKEKGKIVKSEGDFASAYAPQSIEVRGFMKDHDINDIPTGKML